MLSDQNMHLFGVFERNHRERHLKLEKAEHVEKGHKVLECTVSQHAMCAKHTLKYGLFRILNLSNVTVFVLYKNILLWGVRTNHEAIMLVQALQYWHEKQYMLYETVHFLLNQSDSKAKSFQDGTSPWLRAIQIVTFCGGKFSIFSLHSHITNAITSCLPVKFEYTSAGVCAAARVLQSFSPSTSK